MRTHQCNLTHSRKGPAKGHAGFTLVELSAVIFIVAVLVSLLSAALDTTRVRAQQISCLNNNLKELQLAWSLYAEDSNDTMPLNRTAPGFVNTRVFGKRNSTNSWVAGNPKEDVNTANIERGTLYPYVRAAQLYRCPNDNSRVVGHKDLLRTRSYAISAYLNGDEEGVDPRVKTKVSELVAPAPDRVFVFLEEHALSVWGGSFLVLPKEAFTLTTGSWRSTPAERHARGCNLSFADGHVEYWRWNWPKRDNLSNKFTSNIRELNDLRRLESGIPKP